MLPYEKVKAMQEYRFGKYMDARERARRRDRAAEPSGLGEMLNALARGLAGIGLRGRGGKNRPASPAY